MREFVDKHIEIDIPKRCKKLTGTRFASVLGLDKWNTPFKTWCAITKTYEDPFTDNIYTIAGKTIEPKIIAYLNKAYFLNSVKSPTDIYGEGYFQRTFGDFFPDVKVFGGMWDALVYYDDEISAVVEIKTTKRAEDWADGKAPIHYSLQAALYAYLLGVDDIVMVAAFLEDKDYPIDNKDGTFDTTPTEKFVPSVDNTIIDNFSLKERFPDFEDRIDKAIEWWQTYVETGISPDFDEKKDADILSVLRTNTISADTDIMDLIAEAEKLSEEIAAVQSTVADKESRLKELKDLIKEYGSRQFREGDKKVSFKSNKYEWTISRSSTTTIDKTALKKDGLLDKYSKVSETIKLNPPKLIEKEEN